MRSMWMLKGNTTSMWDPSKLAGLAGRVENLQKTAQSHDAAALPAGRCSAAVLFPLAEPPEVTMELSQQIIPWGQSAKFTCEVRGNPQPSVVWLRNAVPLSASHRLRLSRRALRLVSVGPEDDGIYQCMAENEVGSAQAMVQLRTARPGQSLSGSLWALGAGALMHGERAEGSGRKLGYHPPAWV